MKTIYLEPDTINPESCLTVEQSGSLQFIHFKLIKNEAALYRLLARTYGEKKFEIEMRHNVYRIRAPSGCAALDLDAEEMRNIVRSNSDRSQSPAHKVAGKVS